MRNAMIWQDLAFACRRNWRAGLGKWPDAQRKKRYSINTPRGSHAGQSGELTR